MMNCYSVAATTLKTTVALLIFVLLLPGCAFGVAYDNSTVGQRSTLTGNALSGIADEASAVYYNPAGMVGNGRKTIWDIELGSTITATKFYYTDGTSYSTSNDKFVIPCLFMTRQIDDRWAVGFGVYTPFAGGGATYENYLNTGHERSAAVGYTAFTPTVAYKINEQWSVGLGISGYRGIYKSKIYASGQLSEMDYSGLAGVGAHASVMYRPAPHWSIGLTGRTPVHTKMDGEFKINGVEQKSELEANFPYSFDLGIGYRKDRLLAGLSFVWMGYGTMDEIKQTWDNGTTITNRTGFRNGYRLSVGGEYLLLDRLHAIAGMRYVSSMQRDEFNQALSNEVPCIAYSVGARVGVTQHIDLTVGYMFTDGLEHSFQGQKFDADYHTAVVAVRTQF